MRYGSDWLILCNPFPIFIPHFTIAHRRHRPQALKENLTDLLRLARDLSPEFAVFYNGPRCGASAPDHLHFQGFPAGALPMEGRECTGGRRPLGEAGEGLSGSAIRGPPMVPRDGSSPGASKGCQRRKEILVTRSGEREETFSTSRFLHWRNWRVFLFPRRNTVRTPSF